MAYCFLWDRLLLSVAKVVAFEKRRNMNRKAMGHPPKLVQQLQFSSTLHAVAVASPLLAVTVFRPSTQTGPSPKRLFTAVAVSSAQPWQSIFSVFVLGGTVTVHPHGEVEVIVLVHVGAACRTGEEEQAVIFVVPERAVGMEQRTCFQCQSCCGFRGRGVGKCVLGRNWDLS